MTRLSQRGRCFPSMSSSFSRPVFIPISVSLHITLHRSEMSHVKKKCLNDSRDFKDAESVRSGLSHVPSQPALLALFRDPSGMLSRKDKPPDIRGTHGFSGNVCVNPTSVFFSTLSRRDQSFHVDLTKARKSSSRNTVDTPSRRCVLDPSWEQEKGIAFW